MAYAVEVGVPALILLVLLLPRIVLAIGKVYFPSLSLCRSFHDIVPIWNERAKALWATKPARPVNAAAVVFTIAWLGTLILNVPLTAQILEMFFSTGTRVTLPFFGPLYTICLIFALILAVVRAGLGFMLQGRGVGIEKRSYHAVVPVSAIWMLLGLIVAFECALAAIRGQVMAFEGLQVFFLTPEATVAIISGLLGFIVPLAEIFFGGLSLYEFFDPAGAAALGKAGAILIWLVNGFIRCFIAFHDPETLPLPTPRVLSMLEKKTQAWLRGAMSLEAALAPFQQRVPAEGTTGIDSLKADVEKLGSDITEFTKEAHELHGQSQTGAGTQSETPQESRLLARYTELRSRCTDIQGRARNLCRRRWATTRANRSFGRLEVRLNRLAAAAKYWKDRQDQLQQATARLKDEATRKHNEKLLDNLMATLRDVADRTANLQEKAKTVGAQVWEALSTEKSAAKEAVQLLPRVRELLQLLEEARKELMQVTGLCEAQRARQQQLVVLPELLTLDKERERLTGTVASLAGSVETLQKRVADASGAVKATDLDNDLEELKGNVVDHVNKVTAFAEASETKGADVKRHVLLGNWRSVYMRCSQFEVRARRLLRESQRAWRAIGAEGRRLERELNRVLGDVRGLKEREGRLQRTLGRMAERHRQHNEKLLEDIMSGLSRLDERIIGLKTDVSGFATALDPNESQQAMGLRNEAQVVRDKLKHVRAWLGIDLEQYGAPVGISGTALGVAGVCFQTALSLLCDQPVTPVGLMVAMGLITFSAVFWLWCRTLGRSRTVTRTRQRSGKR